jgi:hypothetical protein
MKIMKTIAIIIALVMFGFNTANANEMNVQKYILDTVPGASLSDAKMCADAHRNGGVYLVKIYDITLKCEKNSIVKDWDR